MARSMWMVRAGESGYLFEDFQKNNYVAIGWNEIGDITTVTTVEQVRDLYAKHYPGEKPAKLNNAVAMIFKFRTVLEEGHNVITYNPQNREYLVGTIGGDYRFDPSREYLHVRDVDWLGVVDRDDLSPASRNSLGSTLTLFCINDETPKTSFGFSRGRK